jgi:hypothetical protein
MLSRFLPAAFACSLLLGSAVAQPPPSILPPSPQAPNLNLPQPFGTQPGTSIELTLTGTNLADPIALLTGFPAKVTIPTDANNGKDAAKLRVKIDVSPDAQVGLYPMRLVTKQGVSPFRPFCIDSLPNAPVSAEPATKSAPRALLFPSVASGSIATETSQFYKISVKPGQRVCMEVLARRLGSNLDPIILMHDAKTGREMPSLYSDDSPGCQTDCRLTHVFPEGGDYLIEVRDSTHRGGPDFWYRLRVGDFPSAITPMPLAAKRGSKATIGFAGPDLESVTPIALTVPADPGIEAISLVPKGGRAAAGWPVTLLLSDMDEIVEQEPNNDPAHANRVPVPCGISGRFGEKSDLDCFVFAAKKGQRYLINSRTQDLLSPAEVFMTLKDVKGGEVARSNPTTEAGIDFTAPADGDFVIVAEHTNFVHGPNEVYRITIRNPEPGFEVVLGNDRIEIPTNGSAVLPIQSIVRQNYAGPIELSIVGPTGLTGTATVIAAVPPAPTLPIALLPMAAKDVPPGAYEVRIQAKAMIGGKPVIAFANVTNLVRTAMNGLPFPPRNYASSLIVAITEPPFRLTVKAAEGMRGTPTPVTISATRANDFAEEIALTVVGLPPNVTAAAKPIAKATKEIVIPFTATPAVPLGTYSVLVIGKGKFQNREFAVSALATISLVVPFELTTVAPAALKPGDKAKWKIAAIRKGGYAGPIDVELKNLPAGVTALKGQIAAGKTEVEIEVTAAPTAAAVEKADVTASGSAAGHNAATPAFKVTVTKK